MNINYMVFASPAFLILIGIEYFISIYKKKTLYQLNDSVNNISAGILEECAALPFRGLIIYGYYYLYEHYALLSINPNSLSSWILLWIGTDFFYYWLHRASHRCNFFWLGHSVHHQSEHYNLSVALRQGFWQTMTTWIFYLPLALIGFPTWMFVTVATFNTLYQFWIHTQLIHKMGWFEKIFNTPSHHRVHHGKNQQYIDKNYAGSLIIWDKLFGTFEPEAIQADYGVTEPLDSWNPFYANIKVIKDVLYYSQYLKSPLLAVRAFLMPPEWILQQLEKQQIETIKRPSVQKNKKSPLVYMIVNTGFTLSIYSYLSLTYNPKTLLSWTLIALIALSLYILGSVANGNLKIKFIEFSRVLLMFISLILMTNNYILGLVVGILFYALNQFLFNLQSAFDPVTYVRGT
jgi:sterol desaturase/sphingolipid hydroxylase (fatty acid hydroxylase superfamily)